MIPLRASLVQRGSPQSFRPTDIYSTRLNPARGDDDRGANEQEIFHRKLKTIQFHLPSRNHRLVSFELAHGDKNRICCQYLALAHEVWDTY